MARLESPITSSAHPQAPPTTHTHPWPRPPCTAAPVRPASPGRSPHPLSTPARHSRLQRGGQQAAGGRRHAAVSKSDQQQQRRGARRGSASSAYRGPGPRRRRTAAAPPAPAPPRSACGHACKVRGQASGTHLRPMQSSGQSPTPPLPQILQCMCSRPAAHDRWSKPSCLLSCGRASPPPSPRSRHRLPLRPPPAPCTPRRALLRLPRPQPPAPTPPPSAAPRCVQR